MKIPTFENFLHFNSGDLLIATKTFKVVSVENDLDQVKIYEVPSGDILVYLHSAQELAPEIFTSYLDSVNTVHYLYYNNKIVRLFDTTIKRYFLRECIEKISYGELV